MINKCPSCGKTAIRPFKKMFLGLIWGGLVCCNCKECGTGLKLSTKWALILYFSYFFLFLTVILMFRNLNIFEHTFFSTTPFLIISVTIITIVYIFLYIDFVPLVKSSRTEK